MNKVYIQTKGGLAINADIQNAIDGFYYLGYDIKYFDINHIPFLLNKNIPIIGGIDVMKSVFSKLDYKLSSIDYPLSLFEYINRNIVIENLSEAISRYNLNKKSFFIKPVEYKLFDGCVINDMSLPYFTSIDDCKVYTSELLDIVSEWRVYVHNGQMVYSSNYAGNFMVHPNYQYVQNLINNYKDAPVAYTIDIGILANSENTVIEFNDFYAISAYGLNCVKYAEMLKDRYYQILNNN